MYPLPSRMTKFKFEDRTIFIHEQPQQRHPNRQIISVCRQPQKWWRNEAYGAFDLMGMKQHTFGMIASKYGSFGSHIGFSCARGATCISSEAPPLYSLFETAIRRASEMITRPTFLRLVIYRSSISGHLPRNRERLMEGLHL